MNGKSPKNKKNFVISGKHDIHIIVYKIFHFNRTPLTLQIYIEQYIEYTFRVKWGKIVVLLSRIVYRKISIGLTFVISPKIEGGSQ